jgi:hypothetical protein
LLSSSVWGQCPAAAAAQERQRTNSLAVAGVGGWLPAQRTTGCLRSGASAAARGSKHSSKPRNAQRDCPAVLHPASAEACMCLLCVLYNTRREAEHLRHKIGGDGHPPHGHPSSSGGGGGQAVLSVSPALGGSSMLGCSPPTGSFMARLAAAAGGPLLGTSAGAWH